MLKILPDNRFILIIAVIAAFLIPSLGISRDAGSAPVFAIYATSYKGRDLNLPPLDKLPLLEQPLLTEEDIIEYRWKTHELLLTKQGVEKFRRMNQQAMRGKAFIVVADGARCYHGAFWLLIWSSTYPFPVIYLDAMDLKNTQNIVTIERSELKGPDPRNDERVLNALKQAGKLK